MNNTWGVVGLGNPGSNYAQTRHNIGRQVLHQLANTHSVSLKHHKAGALVGGFRAANGDNVVLIEPESYMNLSGVSVAGVAKFFKIEPENLIVLHDELDLAFGTLKLKLGGGHAGHNGLRSIISHLGADFVRLRLGIGRPPGRQDPADFVLARFASTELRELPLMIDLGAEMTEDVIGEGLLNAQQRHH
ncbi:MAG: aminoacyl-tRNA hydrolase [Microbacteriaceae bacterium]